MFPPLNSETSDGLDLQFVRLRLTSGIPAESRYRAPTSSVTMP